MSKPELASLDSARGKAPEDRNAEEWFLIISEGNDSLSSPIPTEVMKVLADLQVGANAPIDRKAAKKMRDTIGTLPDRVLKKEFTI